VRARGRAEHVEPTRLEVGGLGTMPANLAPPSGHVEDAGIVVHEAKSIGVTYDRTITP
jgi:hypothetical protein